MNVRHVKKEIKHIFAYQVQNQTFNAQIYQNFNHSGSNKTNNSPAIKKSLFCRSICDFT